MSPETVRFMFRFSVEEILIMVEQLRLPAVIITDGKLRFTDERGSFFFLKNHVLKQGIDAMHKSMYSTSTHGVTRSIWRFGEDSRQQ